MDDLISRQAAIALADKLKDDLPDDERMSDAVMAHNEGILEYQTKLSLLPSAQPEIIHCKDCKHQEKFFHEDKRRKEGGYYIFGCELSGEYSHVCLDEDFCSFAERRTDECTD